MCDVYSSKNKHNHAAYNTYMFDVIIQLSFSISTLLLFSLDSCRATAAAAAFIEASGSFGFLLTTSINNTYKCIHVNVYYVQCTQTPYGHTNIPFLDGIYFTGSPNVNCRKALYKFHTIQWITIILITRLEIRCIRSL